MALVNAVKNCKSQCLDEYRRRSSPTNLNTSPALIAMSTVSQTAIQPQNTQKNNSWYVYRPNHLRPYYNAVSVTPVNVKLYAPNQPAVTPTVKAEGPIADQVQSSEGTCPICLEQVTIDQARVTHNTCSMHIFHQECMAEWISQPERANCPMCRGVIREAIRDDQASIQAWENSVLRMSYERYTLERLRLIQGGDDSADGEIGTFLRDLQRVTFIEEATLIWEHGELFLSLIKLFRAIYRCFSRSQWNSWRKHAALYLSTARGKREVMLLYLLNCELDTQVPDIAKYIDEGCDLLTEALTVRAWQYHRLWTSYRVDLGSWCGVLGSGESEDREPTE